MTRFPGTVPGPCFADFTFPSAPALGSTNSAAGCPALFVGFTATMAGSDFSCSYIVGYGSSPSRAPTRTSAARMLALADHEISRFPSKERAHMPVSETTPGRLGARVIAPIRVAFRHRNDVGTQDEGTFAAQWLAYALPGQRFANTLAGIRARLGRCGSLLLHRDGLAPSTPCRFPAHSDLPR